MAKIETLEDFKTWQKARLLNKEIEELTKSKVFNSNFDLKNQIHSAALSVVSNLAEGFARQGNKEFYQFLSISRASLVEVQSHLYVCIDLKLIDRSSSRASFKLISDIQKMTLKLMEHIKNSPLKGAKYK